MKIVIEIQKNKLTCVEVVKAINSSRLNAQDNSPFTDGEVGALKDQNGNSIGTWHTVKE